MKLLSFGKQKQPADFVFQIEGVFALTTGGAVVAGHVLGGVLRQGESALCVSETGNSFPCVIEMIELADPKRRGKFIHPKEVKAEGPEGTRCAVKIPGCGKSDFVPGDRLVPAGSVSSAKTQEMGSGSCKEFLFRIEHIFSIRNVGTAVVGTVMKGSVRTGDMVAFGHAPGEAVFSCKIIAIDGKESPEGGIHPVERACADGPCGYGCALTLEEAESSRFRTGGYVFVL